MSRAWARARSLPTLGLAGIVPVVAAVAVGVTLAFPSASGTTARGGVVIEDFAFVPATVEVRAGEAVTVQNRDGAVHTLTARGERFDTGDIAGGARATIRVTTPGRYRYFCEIHDYMRGVLDVR